MRCFVLMHVCGDTPLLALDGLSLVHLHGLMQPRHANGIKLACAFTHRSKAQLQETQAARERETERGKGPFMIKSSGLTAPNLPFPLFLLTSLLSCSSSPSLLPTFLARSALAPTHVSCTASDPPRRMPCARHCPIHKHTKTG